MQRVNDPKYWLQLIVTAPFITLRRNTKYSNEPADTILDNTAFPGLCHDPNPLSLEASFNTIDFHKYLI